MSASASASASVASAVPPPRGWAAQPLGRTVKPSSHYDILGVDPRADDATIAAAYRHLAQHLHPDRDPSPTAHRLMLRVNAAHEVFKRPSRRAAYDEALGLSPPPAPEVARPAPPVARALPPIEPPLARRRVSSPGPTGGRGSVLAFGRYAGRSLEEVARLDRPYLEWLGRSLGGRQHRTEIERLLARPTQR